MDTYTISEFAEKLNITPYTLRYWEKALALEVRRDKQGYRFYNSSDLEQFRKIIDYKQKGYKISAIKEILEGRHLEVGERDKNQGLTMIDSPKMKQFSIFMKTLIDESIRETNGELRDAIRRDVANEIEKSRQYNEALEEKRFKKLDMTLREMQSMRQEVAAMENSKRKWFFFKKKNKS